MSHERAAYSCISAPRTHAVNVMPLPIRLKSYRRDWNKLYHFTIEDARAFQVSSAKHPGKSGEQCLPWPHGFSCHLEAVWTWSSTDIFTLNATWICVQNKDEQGMSWVNLNGFAQLLQYDRPALAKLSYSFKDVGKVRLQDVSCAPRDKYMFDDWESVGEILTQFRVEKTWWLHFYWQ